MSKKISRLIFASILAVAVIAILMAMGRPDVVLVPASAQDAKSFDEKMAFLAQGHQEGSAPVAHITEAELTSKLQQGLDEIPPSGGAVVLKAASIHLEGEGRG